MEAARPMSREQRNALALFGLSAILGAAVLWVYMTCNARMPSTIAGFTWLGLARSLPAMVTSLMFMRAATIETADTGPKFIWALKWLGCTPVAAVLHVVLLLGLLEVTGLIQSL